MTEHRRPDPTSRADADGIRSWFGRSLQSGVDGADHSQVLARRRIPSGGDRELRVPEDRSRSVPIRRRARDDAGTRPRDGRCEPRLRDETSSQLRRWSHGGFRPHGQLVRRALSMPAMGACRPDGWPAFGAALTVARSGVRSPPKRRARWSDRTRLAARRPSASEWCRSVSTTTRCRIERCRRPSSSPTRRTSIRHTKQTSNHWYRAQSGIFDASLAYELGFAGPDAQEGLASHREQRAPRFS